MKTLKASGFSAQNTNIADIETGIFRRVSDFGNTKENKAVSYNSYGLFMASPVSSCYSTGNQSVVGLESSAGPVLWVTPLMEVLTEKGWIQAKNLSVGDNLARPISMSKPGDIFFMKSEEARILGYLIGDGYVGGKTPISFINTSEELHADAARIAISLGCTPRRSNVLEVSYSHVKGQQNMLLKLCRDAGIWGKLAYEKEIPKIFFHQDISHILIAELIFGLYETDGWVSQERTGSIRIGYATSSEALAYQFQQLLLRLRISSTVVKRKEKIGGIINGRQITRRRDQWECKISGLDNAVSFSSVIPMWGPRGQELVRLLAEPKEKLMINRSHYLSIQDTEFILGHLQDTGISVKEMAEYIGMVTVRRGLGVKEILGYPRIRRDRLYSIARNTGDSLLFSVLNKEIGYVPVRYIHDERNMDTFSIEIKGYDNLLANGIVVRDSKMQ